MNDHAHERHVALDTDALRRLEATLTPAPWDPDDLLDPALSAFATGGHREDAEGTATLRNQLPAILAALTERDRLRAALREIRDSQGRVCGHYDCCDHPACASSYAAWVIADAALTAAQAQGTPDEIGSPTAGRSA